jgi:hypothetical protein
MRSDPLDVQAEATDADTFEALWRTRGRSSLVDGAQVEQLERYHRSCGAVVIGQGRSEHPRNSERTSTTPGQSNQARRPQEVPQSGPSPTLQIADTKPRELQKSEKAQRRSEFLYSPHP